MFATDCAYQSLISLQGIQLNCIWCRTILDHQVLSLFTTTLYPMWEKHLDWAGIEPESTCSASNSSNHSTTGSSMTINCQHKKGNAGKFFYSLSIMLEKPISLEVSFSLSASSYQQQRHASIQEDLNQLYDTRPTLASQYQRSAGEDFPFRLKNAPINSISLNFYFGFNCKAFCYLKTCLGPKIRTIWSYWAE